LVHGGDGDGTGSGVTDASGDGSSSGRCDEDVPGRDDEGDAPGVASLPDARRRLRAGDTSGGVTDRA
jgi:hypothetical protein